MNDPFEYQVDGLLLNEANTRQHQVDGVFINETVNEGGGGDPVLRHRKARRATIQKLRSPLIKR